MNYKNLISHKKGKWSAIKLELNNKQLLIIIGYRILELSSEGIYTMKAQLDIVNNKVKSNTIYRRKFLYDLSIFMITIKPNRCYYRGRLEWKHLFESNEIIFNGKWII